MSQGIETSSIYCSQCGKQGSADARFCSGCGRDRSGEPEQASAAQFGQLGQTAQKGQAGSAEEGMAPETAGGSGAMGFGMAWVIYLAAMLIWVAAMAIPKLPLGTLVYFAAGFVMTRYVMRGIMDFHPVYNTIGNVFSAKVSMFLLWPISMLLLLFKLSVNAAL